MRLGMKNEMQYFSDQVRKVVGKFVNPKISEDFCLILANSFFEEDPKAIEMADYLNLGVIDFAAYKGDFDVFEKCYLSDKERLDGEAINDYHEHINAYYND